VTIEITWAFMQARQNESQPASLLELPDAGHMDLIHPESPAGLTVIDLVTQLAQK